MTCVLVEHQVCNNDFELMLYLTLLLPGTGCAGLNNNLPSNSNISKTVRVNIAFKKTFFKDISISFLMISRLIDFALVVPYLLVFKVCGIVRIIQLTAIERIKQNPKKIKTF